MKLWKNIFKQTTPPETAKTLGRNENCWCGSGLKYKKCHFETDRQYFSQQIAASCRGGS